MNALTQFIEKDLATSVPKIARASGFTNSPAPAEGTLVPQGPAPAPTLSPRLQADSATELEEFFDGVVTEIADDEIRIRTVSSQGEEGDAWLPKEQIPPGEMDYLELGVPVRVSVLVRARPRRERGFSVRFLRPHQWFRPTAEEAAPAAKLLLEAMKQVLGR